MASIIISVFLIVVSILTYRRTGSIKILYTSIAFLSLLVVESIFLLQIIDSSSRIMIPMVYTEVPHILLLAMLALFGLGVLRVEK
jgi:Mn2+/Fe2+ NRAMP family transporter